MTVSNRSARLHAEAQRYMPGGVNSPVRAFRSVGGTPLYIASAFGSRIRDVDGREYIDCVGSWGPMILGHARPEVIEAVCEAAQRGTSFGAPTEGELAFARLVVELVPGIDALRLVSSGTEAAMSAVRLARAATGRTKLIKFEGCYHGHADAFLVKAGSGALTFGQPSSPGVPEALARETLNAPYNDLAAVDALLDRHGADVACIIVEPVAGNMGVVLPEPGFLAGLRRLCDAAGALLVFDEVITGFRLGLGGAQEYYGVQPDLTVLGKIMGGGLPAAAYGGRADLMALISPVGPVYQAGTLSGNPLAVAAGLATLDLLRREAPYAALAARNERWMQGLRDAAQAAGLPLTVNGVASLSCAFCAPGPVRNLEEAMHSDTERYARFHAAMLARGVYLAPSQFEAAFLSTAHSDADVERLIEAARESIAATAVV